MASPAASVAPQTPSSSFESMSRRIVACFRQGHIRLVGVCGWDGVGRQRVMRHAVDSLQSGVDGQPNPFTRVLRLSNGERLADKIYRALLAERDEQGKPFQVWWGPFIVPQYKMLVVIDDLQYAINLQQVWMGQYPRLVWPVQILFSSDRDLAKSLVSSPQSWALYSFDDVELISEPFGRLSVEEAWDILWHEGEAAADELRQVDGVQVFTGDAIMQCFLYATLFPSPLHASPYWLAEGFLQYPRPRESPNFLQEDLTMVNFLIVNLVKRSMVVERPPGSNVVGIAAPLVQMARAIATTTTSPTTMYPSSEAKRKGRFLLEISAGLEEFPATGRWDREDVTRISVASNSIKRLQRLPPQSHDNINNVPGGGNGILDGGENAISTPPSSPRCLNLRTLILANNPLLWEIEDDFFRWTPNLRVLDLSATGLVVLPSSLTCLSDLRFLDLGSCAKLGTISPCLERGFQSLETLHLPRCPLLEMTTASFRQVRNLRLLLLSSNSFNNLRVLDLSGTKIELFPDVARLTNLVRVDMINTKNLRNVDWDDFTRLPAITNWDQCGSSAPLPDGIDGPRISIEEVEVFSTLSYNSPLWHQCFRKFYISISPCTEQQEAIDASRSRATGHPSSFPYTDLIPQTERCYHHRFRPMPSISRRHLRICGGTSPFTTRMAGVIPHVESLHLSDHDTVKSLPISQHPMELKQCQVLRCRNMESIFHGGGPASTLDSIEEIRLFHLTKLTTLYEGAFGPRSFALLRRVHIESCPRMVTVFSSSHNVVLEQLQVLVVKFCANLREVFGGGGGGSVGQEIAPRLTELYLWDLQQLRNICGGCLPNLRTLKLRGCPKLHTLPLRHVTDGQKVEIIAEHKWWENLDETNKEYIKFKGPPGF